METYRYFIWMSISWIPVVIIWIRYFSDFKSYFRIGFFLNILTFIPAVIWDYAAVKNDVWYFIPPFVGPIFSGIPLEEFILILSIPWFIFTATILFKKLLEKEQ